MHRLALLATCAAVTCSTAAISMVSATATPAGRHAGELGTHTASSMIQQYEQTRLDALLGVTPRMQASRMQSAAAAQLSTDNRRLADVSDKWGAHEAYDHGNIAVQIEKISVGEKRATVRAKDTTTLHLRGGAKSEVTRDVDTRIYTFVYQDGQWVLSSAMHATSGATTAQRQAMGAADTSLLDTAADQTSAARRGFKNGVYVGTPDSAATKQRLRAARHSVAASRTGTMKAKATYDGQAAADYAQAHVFTHNAKEYPTWANLDCTNFISQVLVAGGINQVPKSTSQSTSWYYDDNGKSFPWPKDTDVSLSWINAGGLHRFMGSHPEHFTQISDTADAEVGDIVQFRWAGSAKVSHSTVITDIRNGQIYLSYHSRDSLNRPLSQIMATKPGAHVYIYSVH